jgi:PKD repeat protein
MIDWGDGTIEPIASTTPSHTYASIGNYTIKMSGITRFYNNVPNSDYHGKLTAVTDWG